MEILVNLGTIYEYHVKLWLIWKNFTKAHNYQPVIKSGNLLNWPIVQRAPRHAPYTGCRLVLSGGLEWPSPEVLSSRATMLSQLHGISCSENISQLTV